MNNSPEQLRVIDPSKTAEHDVDEVGVEHGPEELALLEVAATAGESVLETAIDNGSALTRVVETDGGMRGIVGAPVPGGRVEALFDGADGGARLERIDIQLEGREDDNHTVGVRFNRSGRAQIFIDGSPIQPHEVQAVAAVIERIQEFQTELAAAADAEQGSLERAIEVDDETPDKEP